MSSHHAISFSGRQLRAFGTARDSHLRRLALAMSGWAGAAPARGGSRHARASGGGSQMAQSSVSGANRSMANANATSAGNRASTSAMSNSGNTASAGNRTNTGNVNTGNKVNTGNVNAGNKVNTGNINAGNNVNTGNVNIGNDVNINIDGGYNNGCCHGGGFHHPIAAAADHRRGRRHNRRSRGVLLPRAAAHRLHSGRQERRFLPLLRQRLLPADMVRKRCGLRRRQPLSARCAPHLQMLAHRAGFMRDCVMAPAGGPGSPGTPPLS